MLLGQAELSIHWIRPVALYLPIHVPQARAQRLGMMASLPLRLASALYTQTLCEISTKTLLKNVQPGRASTEAGEALVSRVTLKHGAVALVRCKLALLQVILSGSACELLAWLRLRRCHTSLGQWYFQILRPPTSIACLGSCHLQPCTFIF